ncbi:hypothetical protein HPP92_016342 [Vanilla planifolia]|uniref:UspA domain-containing protein n=1 Tax=Vanilla planifolia TaxID=51239 RepID=A0A835QIZ9_VANPL|nr:hypothetical protein HPP92_016945 [Vanilla planifolia]KAG0471796.1 hypothetical protein HPP92_016342 [Vanilla planifolia]
MATDSTATEAERRAIVVGFDDSEHSFYALQWTIDHFLSSRATLGFAYKLVVVHAKPIPRSVVGFGAPGAIEVLPYIDLNLKRIAEGVIEKARELTALKSVTDAVFLVVEGDARNVLTDAVERFNADLLVVGSHGYGPIKRAVLGSVSDYCAHHAHCSVMIVKQVKH